jgi:hypothetical protein
VVGYKFFKGVENNWIELYFFFDLWSLEMWYCINELGASSPNHHLTDNKKFDYLCNKINRILES